ncbi:MAG: putative selenium-dependent hydroxylase accessory protein YqeC [Chloroflexi bacterium]|nr:MAG: putative selenium-dependent hydroxylase accessory protein YqeC [Chloroflexota bacterium]
MRMTSMIRNPEVALRAPLWHALALDEFPGVSVVAVVGGGGKTSLVYALAREVTLLGGRAIVTGTTRFTPAPHGWPMPPLIEVTPGQAAPRVAQAGDIATLVVAGVEPQPAGRLAPLSPKEIEAMAALDGVDAVLVEADGSRARPFKAPGDQEPVIPACATHVVAVVGAGVLSQPLDEAHVHRPERVRSLVPGLPVDALCEASLIARVLAHAGGGRKHIGGRAYAVVVNQADTHAEAGQVIAEAIRQTGVARVLVTALRDAERPLR